jgi:hypothetical protein
MPHHSFEEFLPFDNARENTQQSKFLAENCLVALLVGVCGAGGAEKKEIGSGSFDKTFGKEIGDALRQIGCEKVELDGDTVKLKLKDTYYHDVKQNVLERVRLSKDISLNVTRDGGTISISDINGVDLDFGRFSPWVGLPDMKLTRGKAELILPIKNVKLDVPNEAYDNMSDLLKKLGK